MRIKKELQRTEVVLVGKKCDICGKEIELDGYTDMTSICWSEAPDQGFQQKSGTYEVCGINCFNEMLPKVMERWQTVKSIEFDWESIGNSIRRNQRATEKNNQSN